MRFNAKELTCLACQTSDQYDKEGVLIVKERQEGLFRKGEGCGFYLILCSFQAIYVVMLQFLLDLQLDLEAEICGTYSRKFIF